MSDYGFQGVIAFVEEHWGKRAARLVGNTLVLGLLAGAASFIAVTASSLVGWAIPRVTPWLPDAAWWVSSAAFRVVAVGAVVFIAMQMLTRRFSQLDRGHAIVYSFIEEKLEPAVNDLQNRVGQIEAHTANNTHVSETLEHLRSQVMELQSRLGDRELEELVARRALEAFKSMSVIERRMWLGRARLDE